MMHTFFIVLAIYLTMNGVIHYMVLKEKPDASIKAVILSLLFGVPGFLIALLILLLKKDQEIFKKRD